MKSVTDCLGRVRIPECEYADGSYLCPFCHSPVMHSWTACRNPACFARGDTVPPMPPETARELLAQAEEREREKALREDIARWQREYAEQRAQELTAWRAEQQAEAQRRGACLRCLFQSGGRVRFVRHKKPCPKMRS